MNNKAKQKKQNRKKNAQSYCRNQKMPYLCTALENNADIKTWFGSSVG